MKHIFDELRRSRRIQHDACFLSEVSDPAQRPMQMHRGAGLGLNEQVIGSRSGERINVALRFDDHEMHIQRFRS